MSLFSLFLRLLSGRTRDQDEKSPLIIREKSLLNVNKRKSKKIETDHDVTIPVGSYISCSNLEIGCFTKMNGPVIIKGRSPCKIGRYCAFGDDIRIITHDHEMHKANLQYSLQRRLGFKVHVSSKGPVTIGSNVWIGDTAIILSGVSVGEGAVIGAGAVVTRSLPPFSIAAGVPARVHGFRFSERVIAQLMEIRWWDWSRERIQRNRDFFDLDLTSDPDIDLFALIKE